MLLVNIDGCDCTGKSTTIENLIKHYTKQGLKVHYLHFPRYDTPIGKIIKKVLSKEIKMHPSSFQMLCSTDRLEWSVNDYPKLKKNFDLIFVDRHTTSALVYAQIDGLDKEEILFNDRRIVKPDINIILFAPIDVLLKRLEKRNASKELYEKREIMEKALEKYLELYKYYPNVDYINADCTIEKVKNQAIQIINKKLEEDMAKCKIYLGGKMSGLTFEEMNTWREQAKRLFNLKTDNQVHCINPVEYYNFEMDKSLYTEREVKEFDLHCVKNSNIVLVNLDYPNSIGTAIELHMAHDVWNIPVVAFGTTTNHPWIELSVTKKCKDLMEAVNYIIEFYLPNI